MKFHLRGFKTLASIFEVFSKEPEAPPKGSSCSDELRKLYIMSHSQRFMTLVSTVMTSRSPAERNLCDFV